MGHAQKGHANGSRVVKGLAGTVALATVTAGVVGVGTSPASANDRLPVGPQSAQAQRAVAGPRLVSSVPTAFTPPVVPRDRYAMSHGCYAIQAPNGRWLVRTGTTYAATSRTRTSATPFHFQATALGRYLLFDRQKSFPTAKSGITAATAPAASSIWTASLSKGRFAFRNGSSALHASGTSITTGTASGFRLHRTTGCATWPEIGLDETGRTYRGTSSLAEVRGYVDDHLHMMAFPFLGGGIHCGRPWDPYGVTVALKDCPDHIATGGKAAIPEMVLSGKPSHDPTGWPTFKDWPMYDSLTHEGTYFRWVERSWRAGQRILVNLFVENEVLCEIYPNLGNPIATVTKTCNDMYQVRKQAKLIHELQDYVDAQWGGPGKGWYRIVTSPAQARRVINQGKLAVVLGTETSDIFDCSKLGAVRDILASIHLDKGINCSQATLDKGLDELHRLGVRQMVITHKFDNAFGGAKGDDGFNGVATNLGTFVQNGSFFHMGKCAAGQAPDNRQLSTTDLGQKQLQQLGLIFGPLAALNLPLALPLYPPGPQCNSRGLTPLGGQMIRSMAKRHMIVDVDHFDSRTRSQALDLLGQLHYKGIISSHSWADDNALPRVYKLGGFIGPYAGDSSGFSGDWSKLTKIMDGRYYWGVGYGADMNGLGPQGPPRSGNSKNPVRYPFKALGGVTVAKQRSGQRVYDINKDGVDHYGLYPDWIQDLRMIKGNAIVADMSRGAEAYLEMWERADGIANDACRMPSTRKAVGAFTSLRKGTTAAAVLTRLGQPHLRRGSVYSYCAVRRTATGAKRADVRVEFRNSRVRKVSVTG